MESTVFSVVMDWLPIVLSVLALILSGYQFIYQRQRARRETTINAFCELQHDVLDLDDFIGMNIEELITAQKEKPTEADKQRWEKMSGYLARIEQFSVGVNLGVYDLKTLDRMAGSHMIKTYRRVEPIVRFKRDKSNTNKRYEEFEKMVRSLEPYNKGI